MRWKPGQGRSENIEDRRGSSAGGLGGLGGLIPGGGKGGGVIGVVVLLAFVLLGRSCVSDGSGAGRLRRRLELVTRRHRASRDT